jgi:hypothetical protein
MSDYRSFATGVPPVRCALLIELVMLYKLRPAELDVRRADRWHSANPKWNSAILWIFDLQ